ncbi:CFEM domain-containing protein [Mycena chlorophos]|uniref:CFEM domain-containing protein n=1 Tax=Mycena chlorophos TaxID=658473 RepID=A0A8H6S6T1_MYCCL|nr:CFEM domain-containing protein [Mycena chlorophos]
MRFTAAVTLFTLFAASTASTLPPPPAPVVGFPLLRQRAGDDTCLCNNNTFVTSTFQCIESACKGEDLATAIQGAYELCLSVKVTISSAIGAEFSATASLASGSPTAAADSVASTTSAPAAVNSNTDATTTSAALPRAFVPTTAFGLVAIGALALTL